MDNAGPVRQAEVRPRDCNRGHEVSGWLVRTAGLCGCRDSCQYTLEHAVPKTHRPIGPRISIQFRPAGAR